ncbi:MAG: ribose 5-phosphate isomerase B [Cytophagales bacterium]|nr:MAG: ribose 5-phosphate isomerase B [Cytophagales bacterium]TAF62094.1 MAG: ribose 5-phosphate isomerase B [Cytophagales bacterium]
MVSVIYLAGDHAGYTYKARLTVFLQERGYKTVDLGPFSEASVDYPDFAHPLANSIANDSDSLGILVCGSGNGVAMTANKHPKVRAALCWQPEIAALARQHNNANVLCLPARFMDIEMALSTLQTFLSTAFEGGRHQTRVNKIG